MSHLKEARMLDGTDVGRLILVEYGKDDRDVSVIEEINHARGRTAVFLKGKTKGHHLSFAFTDLVMVEGNMRKP